MTDYEKKQIEVKKIDKACSKLYETKRKAYTILFCARETLRKALAAHEKADNTYYKANSACCKAESKFQKLNLELEEMERVK